MDQRPETKEAQLKNVSDRFNELISSNKPLILSAGDSLDHIDTVVSLDKELSAAITILSQLHENTSNRSISMQNDLDSLKQLQFLKNELEKRHKIL